MRRTLAAIALASLASCAAYTPSELRVGDPNLNYVSKLGARDAADCIARNADELQVAPLLSQLSATVRPLPDKKGFEVLVRGRSAIYGLAEVQALSVGAKISIWQSSGYLRQDLAEEIVKGC